MSDKTKKKLTILRNRRTLIINQLTKDQLSHVDISVPEFQPKAPPPEEKVAWTAKYQEHRDKLTGKKRAAQGRWNRFAGTDGAGAQGR